MKFSLNQLTLLVAVTLNAGLALAGGPEIPEFTYPRYDCVAVGVACAGVQRAQGHSGERVIVHYGTPQVPGRFYGPYMGAFLNGQPLTQIERDQGLGGTQFFVSVPEGSAGDLEVFFTDGNGNYESDYGRNFHFTLTR